MTIKTRLAQLEVIEQAAAQADFHAAIVALLDCVKSLRPEAQHVFFRWLHFYIKEPDTSPVAFELCGGRLELTDDDRPILEELDRGIPAEVWERIKRAALRLLPEMDGNR